MKKLTQRQYKDASQPMVMIPITPPAFPQRVPEGPPWVDLPMVAPRAVPLANLYVCYARPYAVWVQINVMGRWRPEAYARWRGRRGAVWLYWRMMRDELARRLGKDAVYRGPLNIVDYPYDSVLPLKDPRKIVLIDAIPPSEAKRVGPLDRQGSLTRDGFRALEDVEFVWPWPDERARLYPAGEPVDSGREVMEAGFVAPPEAVKERLLTELGAGRLYERAWPGYWGVDDTGVPDTQGGPVKFHEAYGLLLKEFGLVGEGTRLAKWHAAWAARCEAEYGRW